MERLLYVIGGLLFLGATVAHVYVRWRLKPRVDDEDVYWEFEENDPAYARYVKGIRLTLTAGCAGILLLFLAVIF